MFSYIAVKLPPGNLSHIHATAPPPCGHNLVLHLCLEWSIQLRKHSTSLLKYYQKEENVHDVTHMTNLRCFSMLNCTRPSFSALQTQTVEWFRIY